MTNVNRELSREQLLQNLMEKASECTDAQILAAQQLLQGEKKETRVFCECGIGGLDGLEGWRIENVLTECDSMGEGFVLECRREIGDVQIGLDFMCDEGQYFISQEYVTQR